MPEIYEHLLKIFTSPINQFFFSFLVIVFGLALFFHIKGERGKFVSVSPTLLTTIGILGTFVGIFIGLLYFDVAPEKMRESIPEFLGGVQTAFATSILGMVFGVIMRGAIVFRVSEKVDESGKADEGFLSVFQEIRDSIKETNNAIIGDDDSSMKSQIGFLRSEAKTSSNEMKEEFRNFANTLAENNSNSLIEALEGVMRDFNTQINEQFGDNFRQLNEAVGRLLEWQENYRQQLADMEEKFRTYIESMGNVETAMSSIRDNTNAIPEAMERLPEIIASANGTLTSFAELRERAESALPEIDARLQALTSKLQEQTEAFENVFQAQGDLSDQARLQMREAVEEMGGYIAALLQDFQNRLRNMEAGVGNENPF